VNPSILRPEKAWVGVREPGERSPQCRAAGVQPVEVPERMLRYAFRPAIVLIDELDPLFSVVSAHASHDGNANVRPVASVSARTERLTCRLLVRHCWQLCNVVPRAALFCTLD